MTSSRSVTASPAPCDACAAEDGGGGGGALWRGSCGPGEEREQEEEEEEAEGAVSEEAMSGLSYGDAATLNGDGGGGEVLDKIDMSLDDIIRLNRAEERRLNGGFYRYMNGQFRPSGSRWGFQQQKGFGRGRFGYRWRGVSGRRRPYRVKTGLAAWKASNFRKGLSPLNRLSLTERRSMYSRSLSPPRSPEWRKPMTGLQWPLPRRLQTQRLDFFGSSQPVWLMDNISSSNSYNGYDYDYNYDEERDNRQASFLSRRGLKVQTQLESDLHIDQPSDTQPPPWRTSTTNGGILTVSIENPTALELTVNPASRLPRSILPPFLIKDPSEQKAPKGVALQFDINSIAKQTGITLNERFRILKEQRFTLSPSKGTRFVTVG